MIRNDQQLNRTREALVQLESALALLKRDRASMHPDRFALMAEPIVEDINRLRGQIDEYTGMAAAIEAQAPLWLRLAGPGLELHDASTSIVTAMIDLVRVGVQAVAEFLQRGSVGARPTAILKEACDLRIVAWALGSVRVGLRLPDVPPSLFEETGVEPQANRALQLYLKAASWAGSEEALARLESEVPDAEQRRLVLNQVARLIPRPRGGLEFVELSGSAVPRGSVQLRREARDRVRQAITSTVQEETRSVEGVLREIDLDQRTFILRNLDSGVETRCAISTEADGLLEIAKDALDHRVLVVGIQHRDPTRRQALPLQVREIEIMGREGDESA